MGHLVGKELYRQLGHKLDNLTVRVPWNDTLYAILTELYSSQEAEIAIKMPYGLADLDSLHRSTKIDTETLRRILDGMCAKGLAMDLWVNGEYRYVLSPMVIGIFEFTMMRTRGELKTKEWARLFHHYMSDDDSFYAANFGDRQVVSPLRALPYEGTVDPSEHVEVLDYEKASTIVAEAQRFAIGICSCRHEKLHAGIKKCSVPLETCATMGAAVDNMVRHGFAREVSRTEMQENLARSRELGLVLCADNVRKDVSFICSCCGCCCNVLLGISRFGYANTVVTSNYLAHVDRTDCSECESCIAACPIGALTARPDGGPEVDEAICLGCGVCCLKCSTGSLRLVARAQRALHPETTIERIILQSLERGTMQNLMFAEPDRVSHRLLRAFVGAFLRIGPVKRTLMADKYRSAFLSRLNRQAAH